MKQRPWEPVVLGGVYLALVLAIGWAVVRAGWFGGGDAVAWQTWAVIAGGTVVMWYTYETREMRRATLRQTEAMVRPFVVMEQASEPGVFTLTNLGRGVALNVEVGYVTIGRFQLHGEPHTITVHFPDILPLLRPDESRRLVAASQVDGRPVTDAFSAHLDPACTNQQLRVTLRYENVEGDVYEGPHDIAPKRLRLVGPRRMTRVA